MRHAANEGFLLTSGDVARDILVPRYYDPRIDAEQAALSRSCHLTTIDDCVEAGHLLHDHGNYIPKIYYGTGPVPYVRTSDIANWEVKASPKHGVPVAVYEEYREEQDVQPSDIFFVHEGTYLIGSAAMVTPFDGAMLYQHHMAKFRVLPDAPFGPYFFLAAIESPTVQRQIRSKQFSADIIDSVVGRLGEVAIPVPKNDASKQKIEEGVKAAILGRAESRERLTYGFRMVDLWLRGETDFSLDNILDWKPPVKHEGVVSFLGYRIPHVSFMHESSAVRHDILVPKYYDPTINEIAAKYGSKCKLVSVSDLLKSGELDADTGDEIGKMSYGTGDIGFVRTSDLASWELKREAKQGVSQEIYNNWCDEQDIAAGDILLIRDGTYLVGSSVLLFSGDLPLLYCGGLYRLRAMESSRLDSSLLFMLLNLPFVRRQMRNKQFTRDVIDTLGRRLGELMLPIPRDARIRKRLSSFFGQLIGTRHALRDSLDRIVRQMYSQKTRRRDR